MLTDKAKTDFEQWLQEKDHTPWVAFYDTLPDVVKLAYIIEWLDTQNIFVNVEYQEHLNQFNAKVKCLTSKLRVDLDLYKTRAEATEMIILKANKIYNQSII